MEKQIFVVNINNYMPDIFSLTFPTVETYAKRIGAQIHIITERLNTGGISITYEKTQIHKLGINNDWNILIDADIAISKQLPDVTMIIPQTHVGVHMSYVANVNFPCDKYFYRDNRNIAIAADFMVVSQMCHDIWTPLENPTEHIIKRPFILDEFCFSRNLAKFGLKFAGIIQNESLIFHLNQASSGTNTLEQLRQYIKDFC